MTMNDIDSCGCGGLLCVYETTSSTKLHVAPIEEALDPPPKDTKEARCASCGDVLYENEGVKR